VEPVSRLGSGSGSIDIIYDRLMQKPSQEMRLLVWERKNIPKLNRSPLFCQSQTFSVSYIRHYLEERGIKASSAHSPPARTVTRQLSTLFLVPEHQKDHRQNSLFLSPRRKRSEVLESLMLLRFVKLFLSPRSEGLCLADLLILYFPFDYTTTGDWIRREPANRLGNADSENRCNKHRGHSRD